MIKEAIYHKNLKHFQYCVRQLSVFADAASVKQHFLCRI